MNRTRLNKIMSNALDKSPQDADSPIAPSFSPLTPLVATARRPAAPEYADSPIAPSFSPLTPLVATARRPAAPEYADSPIAPSFSPLTPLVATARRPAAPEYADSPIAPSFSPLTPLVATARRLAAPECDDSPLALCYTPLTPLVATARRPAAPECDDSPLALCYTPLTPLVATARRPAAPECDDSPLALCYTPLTPLVATARRPAAPEYDDSPIAVRMLSPLPPMSPSTLEVVEFLFAEEEMVKERNNSNVDTTTTQVKNRNEITSVNDFSGWQVTSRSITKRRCSENDLSIAQIQVPPSGKKTKRSYSISKMSSAIGLLHHKSPIKRPVSDPSTWKRNVEKQKRLKGEAYKTIQGKLVKAAPLIRSPTCSCKTSCNTKISVETREKIYFSFRSLGTLQEQRQYIVQHVTKKSPVRKTKLNSRKKFTTTYTLSITETVKVDVCKNFFLQTLNIKEGIVRGALNKVSSEGILLQDQRGRRPPVNKLSLSGMSYIKKHILSFPSMESHYCRKNTEYRYLEADLNLTIMYRLYKESLEAEGKKPACLETYRKIFKSYKLKFHVPRKDLCKKCVAFEDLNKTGATDTQKEDHITHLARRDDAFSKRNDDKIAAQNNAHVLSFNFDLEAVLQTPKGAAGPFFYVRKLAVYNLTVYELGNQNVECFTWDETQGKRGSTEIATCIYNFISSKQGITEVKMMSDNCGGQQKNFNFSAMLLYLVVNSPTIETIDHVFFESGHSHMECDSAHAKIEKKCKNIAVYTPEGWIQVMKLARTNPQPFNVTVLNHDEFINFNTNQCQFAAEKAKKQSKKKHSNKKQNTNKEDEINKIGFQDAVWIQYRKDCPTSIFISDNYKCNEFQELKLKPKKGKSDFIGPVAVYDTRLQISKAKKNDLIKLCSENQIPNYYHPFYINLPASDDVRDTLPEPDVDEI